MGRAWPIGPQEPTVRFREARREESRRRAGPRHNSGGTSNTRPASAMALIIMPFHAVMTLSSSPGGIRLARARIDHRLDARDGLLQLIDGDVPTPWPRLRWACGVCRTFWCSQFPGRRHIVVGAEATGIFIAFCNRRADFLRSPDEEFSFDSFGVGIGCGIKSSVATSFPSGCNPMSRRRHDDNSCHRSPERLRHRREPARALSYSIFSKCGTSQRSSVE